MPSKKNPTRRSRVADAVAQAQGQESVPAAEEHLIPPLFENTHADEPAAPDSPKRFTTEPVDKPAQPIPGDEQIPDLPALRNRLADIKQDLSVVTNRLAVIQGYQSPELVQAIVRATEFMFWMDMSVQKAEAEELARAAGFEVRKAEAAPPQAG